MALRLGLLTPSKLYYGAAEITRAYLGAVEVYSSSAPAWTPADLGAALSLWLDAADAATVTLNGSTVSQWRDKSGNGNHANQSTAANQPEIGAFTQNGLNLITVRNIPKFMSVANSPIMRMGFGVVNIRNTTSLSDILVIGSTSTNTHEFFIRNGSPQVSFDGLGATNGKYNLDGGAFSGFAEDHTASSLGCHIWGGVFASSNNLNNIISRPGGNVSSIGGDIGEIVWVTSELADADRQKLEGYLAWKWGLQANLPVNHPYRYDGTLFGYYKLWTPAEISTALWLDAADASTITLNGSTVSQWRDKSKNSRHVNQPTASKQPTYTLANQNGLNVISFDGNNRSLFASSSAINLPQPFSRFVAAQFLVKNNQSVLLDSDTTNTQCVFYNGETGTNWVVANGIVPAYTSYSYGTRDFLNHQHFHIVNGAESYWGLDGSSLTGPLSGGPGGQAGIRIGNIRTELAPLYSFNGRVFEIVLVSGIISTSDRQKLEGYLAWKWGTVASLPAGHPYKLVAPTV